MPLFNLSIPSGMRKNGTLYQSIGRWFDGTLIRFVEGCVRPLGGWQELTAEGDGPVEYEDTFTDTNGTNLEDHEAEDATWTKTNGSGSIVIQSNELQNPASSTAHLYVWNLDADVDVVDATINFNAINTSNSRRMGIVLRGNIADAACYFVVVGNSNSQSLTILRSDSGGAFTTLALDLAALPLDTANHVLRVTIVGSVITAYIDGAQKLTATDATIASGLVGVGMSGSISGVGRIHDLTVSTADNTTFTLDGVPRAILGWRGNDGSSSIGIGTNTKLYAHWLGSLYDLTPAGFTAGTVDAALGAGDYGDGLYGVGFYGMGDPNQTTFDPPAVWHLDNWGDYLVGCCSPNDGKIYYWDRNANNIAVVVDGSAPTGCTGIVVTPERYLVALAPSGQVRTVQWSAQEDYTNWSETADEASTVLTSSGVAPTNGDTVTIGSKTYTFKTVITAADGDVLIGTAAQSLQYLKEAVNLTGSPGTNYATATTANTLVSAGALTATTLAFTAVSAGTAGNIIPSTKVAVTLSFPGTTLSGGTDDGGAGSFTLEGKGGLVAGRRAKSETLLWTTDDLHAMRYIGGTLVYAFERVGGTCGLIAPGAVAQPDVRTLWMSQRGFFLYDGNTQPIECEVSDYVFADFNRTQAGKVTAYTRAQFGEVTWHYPSSASDENDRYVTFNYRENHWTVGLLERTAGCDAGAIEYPVACAANGKIYEHERGSEHLDVDGITPLIPTVEAGPVQMGDGEQVLAVSQLIPDEKNPVGTLGVNLGNVELSLYTSFYPGEAEVLHGPFTIRKLTDARFTGRWVRPVITQEVSGDWRFGVLRLDGKPAGKR